MLFKTNKVTEEEASREFNLLIYQSATRDWQFIQKFLKELNVNSLKPIVIENIIEPEFKFALALHATSVCILANLSPIFENDLARRNRLSFIITRCFINDYSKLSVSSVKNQTTRMAEYQTQFIKGIKNNINPFVNTAGLFLIDIFGIDDIKNICLDSGDINPFVNQTIADSFSLGVNNLLLFWKDIQNEFKIIESAIK